MKKLLLAALLAFLVAVSQPVAAQTPTVFAPSGAEWWYNTNTISGPYLSRVYVVNDTLLPGLPGSWRVLQSQFYGYLGNGVYTAGSAPQPAGFVQVRGRQVWASSGQGAVLYVDFAAGPGFVDSIARGCVSGKAALRIDSVGTCSYGGNLLVRQYRYAFAFSGANIDSTLNALFTYTGQVIERLGYLNAAMFPRPQCGTDPDYPSLLAYSDGNLRYGVAPVLGLSAESAATRALQPAPNPSANGRFRLSGLVDTAVGYAVFDGRGRRVRAGHLTAASAVIDLGELPAGLYLLRGALDGQAFTRRLVRE